MAPEHIQWGTITLHLDHEPFRTAFTQGRNMYFDDCECEFPHVASRMATSDVADSVLDEDEQGGYCFDRMAFKNPLELLGFFLGYMSGPVISESVEEQQERMKRVVILPEPASTASLAL